MTNTPTPTDTEPQLPVLERYRQAFETWRFASSVRLKLLASWWAVYGGLAVVFAWLWKGEEFKHFAFIIPVVGIIATVLFWFMDDRNGGAIYHSKRAIESLEKADNVPAEQRIVEQAETRGLTHASAITIFALVMGAILLWCAIYLYCNRGT